ncbi:MAG: hypothetical protein QXK89_10550 [Candidatus Bathyarchaeia archaeon]
MQPINIIVEPLKPVRPSRKICTQGKIGPLATIEGVCFFICAMRLLIGVPTPIIGFCAKEIT